MKKLLRILAVVLVAGALGAWLATGMNQGWSGTFEQLEAHINQLQ